MSYSKITKSNTLFASDLFSKLVMENKKENIFCSPFSISFALAMTYVGSRKNTRDELRKALHYLDFEDQDIHNNYFELMNLLNKKSKNEDDNFVLKIANRLFGEKSYQFLPEFISTINKYYSAILDPVDFKSEVTKAETHINDWVSKETCQKIPTIINTGTLDKLTRLVLVNAVYFKGLWELKFQDTNTLDEDFHVNKETIVKVKMMYMFDNKFNIGRHEPTNSQIVQVPYCGDRLSIFILLPPLGDLEKLEAYLTGDFLANFQTICHMRKRDVDLSFPRFELDFSITLNDLLQKVGIVGLFQEGVADLSGMDGSKSLYISKVLHKTYVKVDEKGTEAAAATAVIAICYCASIAEKFHADRPFIFFIRDSLTGAIIFMGRVNKP